MGRSKKRLQGEGWTFIPAASGKEAPARRTSEPPSSQRLTIARERRAKGKVVTVARGFCLAAADGKALVRELKGALGTGGRWTEDRVEIQGDHMEALAAALRDRGYSVQ